MRNIPSNALHHHHWKNTSFIFDGRSSETTNRYGEQLAIVAYQQTMILDYKIVYGKVGHSLTQVDRQKLNSMNGLILV